MPNEVKLAKFRSFIFNFQFSLVRQKRKVVLLLGKGKLKRENGEWFGVIA